MTAAEKLITENLDIWAGAVKTRSSAGRGSSGKLELYGIKKLRELILELAVRGLLVPQDPNDEPASVLLEKITAEKEALVKAKKTKKNNDQTPIEDRDIPSTLPDSWCWVRFGDIAQHNSGKTLDKGRNSGRPKKYLTTSNLYWGKFKLDNVKEMLIKDEELDRCTAQKGDLLICEGGEAGRAAVWDNDEEICIQNHIHRARFFSNINPYFAYRVFEKLSLTGEIDLYRRGVGISNMSGKALASIVFPLPPLLEQKRIVAKVDKLMALCDQLEQQQEDSINAHRQLVETLLGALINAADNGELETAWARIADHFDTLFTTEHSIDQLKQTILQLAVMGKLVPQNSNDEPASVLLEKIAAEKEKLVKEGKIKKQKPLPPISEDEKPFELPEGWEWARIGGASLYAEYGVSAKTFEMEEGIPVLKMGDIQSGKVFLGGQKKAAADFDGISRLMLENGDVLYNRTNSAELVGKTGIYIGPNDTYSFASYLIRIKCLEKFLCPEFLNLNMNTPLFRETQIEPHLKQQCGQANVNGTIMKNMLVVVAPKNEQKRIMSKVSILLSICDRLKSCLAEVQSTQLSLANAYAGCALV